MSAHNGSSYFAHSSAKKGSNSLPHFLVAFVFCAKCATGHLVRPHDLRSMASDVFGSVAKKIVVCPLNFSSTKIGTETPKHFPLRL